MLPLCAAGGGLERAGPRRPVLRYYCSTTVMRTGACGLLGDRYYGTTGYCSTTAVLLSCGLERAGSSETGNRALLQYRYYCHVDWSVQAPRRPVKLRHYTTVMRNGACIKKLISCDGMWSCSREHYYAEALQPVSCILWAGTAFLTWLLLEGVVDAGSARAHARKGLAMHGGP